MTHISKGPTPPWLVCGEQTGEQWEWKQWTSEEATSTIQEGDVSGLDIGG